MRCRYCQRRIPILRKLSDAEFCSDEHRLLFLAEQERLALARLVEAQQRFAQEALQVTRTARPHQEVIAPMASFVWNGPWEHAGESRVAGQAAPLPYKESVHLPRLEDSGVAAIARRPSRLHRPRAAAASGAVVVVASRRLRLAPPELPAAAPCTLPTFRPRLNATLPLGQPEPFHFEIPSPRSGARDLAAPAIDFAVTSTCILPQGRLSLAPPAMAPAALAAGAAPCLAYGASDLESFAWPFSGLPLSLRMPVATGILKPVAPGLFNETAGEADLSEIAPAEWTVLAVNPASASVVAYGVEVPLTAITPRVLMPEASARVQAPAGLSVEDGLANLEGPPARNRDVAVWTGTAEALTDCAPDSHRLPGLNLLPGCALNSAEFKPLGLEAAEVPAFLESNPASLPEHKAAQLPQPTGAAFAPAALPAALALVSNPDVLPAESPCGLRAVPSGAVAFGTESLHAPECGLSACGANFEARTRMAWLGFAVPPVDQESKRVASPERLEWQSCKPALPRLRIEPCAPAAVTGEDLTTPLPERLAAVSALSRFWTAAPAEMRWAVAMLPLVFGLIWYTAGERPRRGEDGRVETAAASRPVAQFVKARWESVRQGIAERAGVELFDDFRSGLSSWQGGKDWAESWSYDNAGFARTGALALFTPSVEMADYDFEFLGRIEKKALSWVVRAPDTRNYHALKIVVTRPGPLPSIALVRSVVIEGKEGPQTRIPLALTVTNDTLYRVKTTVRGNSFTVSVQGQVVATWSDERLRRGGVGFFSSKGEQSLLRWVTVTHQYDTIGKLCAYLAPFSIPSRKGD